MFYNIVPWSTNGAGLQFSHSFGFGLMDAGKLVKNLWNSFYLSWRQNKLDRLSLATLEPVACIINIF